MVLISIIFLSIGILIGIGAACTAMITRCTSMQDAYERGREDGKREETNNIL